MVKQSLDHFGICVKIIEASDLPHPNISSLACVQVGASKQCTKAIKHTDKPRFNEYFVFDLKTGFMELLNTVLTISLHEPRNFMVSKLIGTMSMEVSTVWALEGRRMKRWVVVNLPSDVTAVQTGFVHCDISIEASTQLSRIPLLTPVDMPNVIGGITGRYMVRIYRCVGLETDDYTDSKQAPEVFVRVCYARRSESTTKRKLCDSPEWNEQITFIELVPPLYQKISVELLINKSVLASKDFYLYRISHISSKDGFYPTYGPTYVHLYDNKVLYQTSLLMAIETEHLTLYKYKEKLHAVLRHPTKPTYEPQLRKMETFLVLGVVFDVVLIEGLQIKKPVHVGISFGRKLSVKAAPNMNTATSSYRAQRESSSYQYLPVHEQKPCLFVQSEWPDTRHRLYNCNVVAKLADYLRDRVEFALNLQTRGSAKEAEDMLKSAMKHIKTECKATLDQLSKGVTKLDSEGVNLMMTHITQLSSTAVVENNIESLIEKSNTFLSTLDLMSEGMQDSLPYVILSVVEDATTLCTCTVHPKEIIFSQSGIKKGKKAGKIASLPLLNEDQSYMGQMNVWLWLGLWSDVSECLRSLPPGHEDISKSVTLPLSLTYDTDYLYVAVCHILRGTIRVESNEGLCDPFVSILLSRHSKQTKQANKTLTPMWNETLVLKDVQLYPTPQFLERHPPKLTVELLDGSGSSARSLGSTMITPKLRLQPLQEGMEFIFQWYTIGQSQILAFFEIVQVTGESTPDENLGHRRLSSILPKFVDPPTFSHRLEIVFWGIRATDTRGLKSIVQPQAVIQCGPVEIKSEFVVRTNKAFNFKHDLNLVQLDLPQTKLYTPPLTVRLMTSAKYFGTNIENNVYKFLYVPSSERQWRECTSHRKSVVDRARSRRVSAQESMPDLIPLLEQGSRGEQRGHNLREKCGSIVAAVKDAFNSLKNLFSRQSDKSDVTDYSFEEEEEELDWWVRYYLKELKIYKSRLEDVKDFDHFNDVLKTFPVVQKNQQGQETIANVKMMVCLYRWPVKGALVTKQGQDLEKGVLKNTELSERVKLLVRVYCIKAVDLHPADNNGSADPFIEIATQSKVVSDEARHISQQLNPFFGRCLEIRADLPVDTILAVRVMDYDRVSSHDLIGETVIDLENRFYSEHRATCGLASSYSVGGHDSWRDVETPSVILEKLCNSHNLPLPQYFDKSVVVASKEFKIGRKIKNKDDETQEHLALQVLRRWSEVPIVGLRLVPEHVETRPIYNNVKRPGIEQGALEMWVDMFDLSLGEVPPPIDITPRKPQPYVLRIIILNTAKIPLVDDSFFVGKKHTDIYVKGWLCDSSGSQSTDVHYTSINGTGNFNWRFVFPFLYLRAEKRVVTYRKNIFEVNESEHKAAAIVSLQVWDKDRISANDFIGSLEVELCRMPRGARTANSCSEQISEDESKRVDLFKVKRLVGWWPFTKVKDGTRCSAGFLEAEFLLLTADEAVAAPAGLGRSEPAALTPPLRPNIRVKFWLAPFRVLYYMLCTVHKKKVLLCLGMTAVTLFVTVGVYSIPMFIIKKIIGA